MRAAQYDRYGPPDVLDVVTVPIPTPAPHDVLVRVHASGLNPKDAILREGGLRRFSGRRFPKRTGFDVAGTVAALGAGVTTLRVGQPVWGLLDGFQGGAAAEYVVVPARCVAPKPSRVGYAEAAAIPLVGLTALQALRDAARLRPGEHLLINGGSGGVGSAAIQLARAMGAQVTALASHANLDHCRTLGAHTALDYTTFDPAPHVRTFDAILDAHGTPRYREFLRMLRPSGRFISLAPTPGVLLSSLLSRVTPLPGTRVIFVNSNRDDLDILGGYVQRGALRMPIQATYTLDDLREAHGLVRERHARGKRVLLLPPELLHAARDRAALAVP